MMKKTIKMMAILLVATIFLPLTQGCQKYPDGPIFSLNTRTARISNSWKVDNYKVNGTDYTSLVTGYTEKFTEDGDYSYDFGLVDGTGKWAFQNDNAEVRITGVDNQSSVTLVILKLEKEQFWYYIMDGDDKKEFHMVQE